MLGHAYDESPRELPKDTCPVSLSLFLALDSSYSRDRYEPVAVDAATKTTRPPGFALTHDPSNIDPPRRSVTIKFYHGKVCSVARTWSPWFRCDRSLPLSPPIVGFSHPATLSLSVGNPTPRIVLSSVNAAEIVYARFYDNRERDVAVKLCRCPVSRTVVTRIALQRRSVSRQATARYRFPLAEKRVQRARTDHSIRLSFASTFITVS